MSYISHISKLWLEMLYASQEVNSTISVGMDITNDLSQQNGCDIIIERGELRVEKCMELTVFWRT
jgi:hypothetical protein